MKTKTKRIIAGIIITIILIMSVFFIMSSYNDDEINEVAEISFNYGYNVAIMQLTNLSLQCEPFSILYGNYTFQLINTKCIIN